MSPQSSQSDFERGDIVRPAPWVVEDLRQFTDRPRPVRRRTYRGTTCSYCDGVILVGDLYAAGLEVSRPLCLGCVEPVGVTL